MDYCFTNTPVNKSNTNTDEYSNNLSMEFL